jgi:hypothetical protein
MGHAQRRWLAAVVVAGAASLGTGEALGQAEPVAVEYRAYAGCPDEAAFFAELGARSPRIRLRAGGEPGWTVGVVIARSEVVDGRVTVVRSDGSQATRNVSGSVCAEVASELALIAALMIDPRASVAVAESRAPEPAPLAPLPEAPPGDGWPGDSNPPPVPPAPLWGPPARGNQPPASRPTWVSRSPGRGAGAPTWVAGAEAQALFGSGPSGAFGGGGFVAVESRTLGSFAIAGRLGLLAVTTSDGFGRGVGGRFTWILARPQICPLRPLLAEALRLDACVLLDAGLLRSNGSGLNRPEVSLRPWFAAGVLARLCWRLPSSLRLEAGGGPLVPFYHYQFEYGSGGPAGDVEVHQVPALGALATLGVGYGFE